MFYEEGNSCVFEGLEDMHIRFLEANITFLFIRALHRGSLKPKEKRDKSDLSQLQLYTVSLIN